MIYFNKKELKEILRTFKYGSYPSSFDDQENQRSRRLKIINKIENQIA
tara:strand:+ start:1814 stop:1957 length:144 start_codon:yes stop_codon:yes gene_type:complete